MNYLHILHFLIKVTKMYYKDNNKYNSNSNLYHHPHKKLILIFNNNKIFSKINIWISLITRIKYLKMIKFRKIKKM